MVHEDVQGSDRIARAAPAARIARVALAAALSACALAAHAGARDAVRPAAPQTPAVQAQRYVRVKTAGAALTNLPDRHAESVLHPSAGTLLAVYSERAGQLEVESPSGLEVWVFGQYVRPIGSEIGLIEVIGNNVLMRPLPQSDEKSYPLAQRLHAGDRLRVIARADAKKPLEADWVKVIAPPGTHAWIQASDTEPLAASANPSAEWKSAVQTAQAALKPIAIEGASTTAASAAVESKTPAAADTMADAERAMVAARAAEKPDFTEAKAAYQKILDQSPKGSAADMAHLRLEEIAAREEIQKLKSDSQVFETKRQEELHRAESRLTEISKRQDPLWGRFQARGWVERDGDRCVIRWGGKTLAELTCSSGRYDLYDFRDSEVGVVGVTVRSAVAPADGMAAAPARLDVTRIEVISGRQGG